jgi:uncharacterized protein (TIGR02421 family)
MFDPNSKKEEEARSKRLQKNMKLFEKLIERIDKKLPFMGMNPVNEASEKKRFFKEKDYNPVFRYKKVSSCEKLLNKASDLEIPEGVMRNLLMQRLEKFKRTNAMLQNLGKDEFTYFSKGIFGKPSPELVARAYDILQMASEKEELNIESKKVLELMKKSLAQLGLKGWKASLKKMASNAAVISSQKHVYVKKSSKVSESFMKRVIVHEIGTHVFRTFNGESQPYKIFLTGLPNYLTTEEGLAVNIEEMHGCLRASTLRAYAGRVIAINSSLQKGFRDVYNELKNYFDDDFAWRLALRAKRGLYDTSKTGAYTKDYLYLEGYYKVKDFLQKEGDEGLRKLYYGKMGIEHIPLLSQIEGLKEPMLVPNSEQFKKVVSEIKA